MSAPSCCRPSRWMAVPRTIPLMDAREERLWRVEVDQVNALRGHIVAEDFQVVAEVEFVLPAHVAVAPVYDRGFRNFHILAAHSVLSHKFVDEVSPRSGCNKVAHGASRGLGGRSLTPFPSPRRLTGR